MRGLRFLPCVLAVKQNKAGKQNEIHFDIVTDEGPKDVLIFGIWGYGIPDAQIPKFSPQS